MYLFKKKYILYSGHQQKLYNLWHPPKKSVSPHLTWLMVYIIFVKVLCHWPPISWTLYISISQKFFRYLCAVAIFLIRNFDVFSSVWHEPVVWSTKREPSTWCRWWWPWTRCMLKRKIRCCELPPNVRPFEIRTFVRKCTWRTRVCDAPIPTDILCNIRTWNKILMPANKI